MYVLSVINNLLLLETISYSSFFPENAIKFVKEAICNTSAHAIDIFYDKNTITTDHILKAMYSDCENAPLLLNTLNESIKRPVILSKSKLLVKVLILNSLQQVDNFMEIVYEYRFEKHLRKYFVIVEAVREPNNDQWLYYLFVKFWQKQVLNVVVIFYNNSVQMHTYRLLADEDSGISVNISKPDAMQKQNFNLHIMNITGHPTSKIFFNKLTNLRKRKLVVTMFPLASRSYAKKDKSSGYTGIDGNVADLIRSRMNATFDYISPNMVYNGSNNTGLVGDLFLKRADFSFNALAYSPYNFKENVEITNAFDHVKFCVIIPKNGLEPIALNIFHALSTITWIFVIGSIIFIVFIFAVVQHIQKNISNAWQTHKLYSIIEFTAIALQSFLGDSIERVSSNTSIRWIFMSWLLYSFLITNAFTATIISSLIKPNHLKNIETIEELAMSNLTIFYPKFVGNFIKHGFDDKTWQSFGDNFKEIESWEKFMQIMNANKSQYGYVMGDGYCRYIMNGNIDETTGESIYHMVPQCLSSHPRVYIVQRGSMYLGYINQLLGQFYEMGMFQKWTKDSHFWSMLKGLNTGNVDVDIDYSAAKVVITIEQLQTPFYMLALGLSVSLVAFLIERWWHKYMEKKCNLEIQDNVSEEFEFELE